MNAPAVIAARLFDDDAHRIEARFVARQQARVLKSCLIYYSAGNDEVIRKADRIAVAAFDENRIGQTTAARKASSVFAAQRIEPDRSIVLFVEVEIGASVHEVSVFRRGNLVKEQADFAACCCCSIGFGQRKQRVRFNGHHRVYLNKVRHVEAFIACQKKIFLFANRA